MTAPIDWCPWCHEPILPGERTEDMLHVDAQRCSSVRTWHWECRARIALGSVGHQKGECHCFGGTEEDPPGSKRDAARAALAYARSKGGK